MKAAEHDFSSFELIRCLPSRTDLVTSPICILCEYFKDSLLNVLLTDYHRDHVASKPALLCFLTEIRDMI